MGTAREKLIKKLKEWGREELPDLNSEDEIVGKFADFMIEDRKRIVEPLVKHKKLWCGNWKEYTASESIDATLKNAGLE